MQTNSWLTKLSHVQQAELVSIMGEERSIGAGAMLWEQGDVCDRVFIVSKGLCTVNQKDRQLGRGTHFGHNYIGP